jgi:hypothetical protein
MDKDRLTSQHHTSEAPSVTETTDTEAVSARRRRLIKASAAVVPAILTLRSGAAAAARASVSDCRENDAQRASGSTLDDVLGDLANEPAHDEWLRMVATAGMEVTAKVNQDGNEEKEDIFHLVETTSSTSTAKDYDYFDASGVNITDDKIISKIEKDKSFSVPCYYVDKTLYHVDNPFNGPSTWEYTVDQGYECSAELCTKVLPQDTDLTRALASDGYKKVQLLASVAWGQDSEVAYITYYPQIAVSADHPGAPITESCWCSVSPNTTV